ncbi:uncharacterized protein BKA55DRAFT_580850 [Fusarium redolens]|uniref:Uncharacterized protein n=1 Tax=Fusarium redolens TaxID=48865 RepID=A0A9P9G544_FUSRE|nr:uncharacterized protein BKA55DRAFT_580850 [Fusarium redolens]KAH7232220.1 hypothetical protein BKA55DRAFT_580850 [Fusarium redolens]
MPDLIPYFTAVLEDHERKDELYAIAMEIGKTWDKEDDITGELLWAARSSCLYVVIAKS